MRSFLGVVLLLVLAAGAHARPPSEQSIPSGRGWWCPDGKVRGMAIQCTRTMDTCEQLLDTAIGTLGGERPTCRKRTEAHCVSWRVRSGARPPEAVCYADRPRCAHERRSVAGDPRYAELSSCARRR